MSNEQLAVVLASILQRVKCAEHEAMGAMPDEAPRESESSVKARVQGVFYNLENDLRAQLFALGTQTYV